MRMCVCLFVRIVNAISPEPISKRHAVANNLLVEGYESSKPTSYITYRDANNLYGSAMSDT